MEKTAQAREWLWFARELRPYVRSHVFSISCLLAATILSAIDPLIIRWIIDSGLGQRRWLPIMAAVGAFCAVYVVRVGVLSIGTYSVARTVRYAMLRLRLRLLKRIQTLDAAFFQGHGVGDLVTRLEQEIDQLSEAAAEVLPSLFRVVAGIAITITVMLVLDWRLALVTTPLALLLGALRYRYGPTLEQAARASRQIVGERASFLSECIGAAIELQLLGAESYINRRYAKLSTASIRTSLGQLRTEIRYAAMAFAVITLTSAVVLLAGAWEYMNGRLTLGSYIAFYTYLVRLFDPLAAAISTYVRLKRAGGSISRLTELEQHQSLVPDGVADAPLPALVNELVFRDVRFGYDESAPILRGVDVTVRRGEKVALMGKSGSGKSTLAKLLVRLYDPHAGSVSIDGTDVRRLRIRALRRTTSLVPPTPSLFRGTIRENVLLGYRRVDDPQLERLAAIACFDSVVAKLPDGWDHLLGPSGAGLSEGEKQRLGLLRALVRHRDVLILDEATGALDSRTEADLLARLRTYAEQRLVLVITHRPSPADWADRVLVLQDGRLTSLRVPEGVLVGPSYLPPVLPEPTLDL
ncbi:MAG: transporter related protein [Acidobacteria bacterium]|nr:transporter related protein [Acidobacteriota bacterium]